MSEGDPGQLEGDDLKREIRNLLVPEGEPIGEPGLRRGVRTVQGGLSAAEEILNQLEVLGEPLEHEDYPGRMVRLGEEGTVGLRYHSKSGAPTMDVQVQCVPEIRKATFE